MFKIKYKYVAIGFLLLIFMTLSLLKANNDNKNEKREGNENLKYLIKTEINERKIEIIKNIKIRNYFNFIDSLVLACNSSETNELNEHLLIRNNPWVIDSLSNTDYYKLKDKNIFVFDQKELVVLPEKSSLIIPDSTKVKDLLNFFKETLIDINIPEFKLRIYRNSELLYTFPIRVGSNNKRYLKMGNRITDLRTIIGEGIIVRHVRNPSFYNPVNSRKFTHTVRDDKKLTLMPQIPWIETEINRIRNGQMIHPTTNPNTLEKAYSNGCIGVREGDMWIIYYNAPIGTKVNIRYDLEVTNEKGEFVSLKDIYGYDKK